MKIDRAIKKTIDYAQKYNCRLTGEEVSFRLISKSIFDKDKLDQCLKRYQPELSRKNKNDNFTEKMIKAEKLVRDYLTDFKDIMMVGVTGSVAAGYPKANDDIDLMIITKSYKLWITRLKIRWLIFKKMIPHRRYGLEEKKDEFCFNLWLGDNHLEIPREKQNLKNAVDLILMKPILNKGGTYERFILANIWAKRYVATGYQKLDQGIINKKYTEARQGGWLSKMLNIFFYIPQKVYMKPKLGKSKVGADYAFFHP